MNSDPHLPNQVFSFSYFTSEFSFITGVTVMYMSRREVYVHLVLEFISHPYAVANFISSLFLYINYSCTKPTTVLRNRHLSHTQCYWRKVSSSRQFTPNTMQITHQSRLCRPMNVYIPIGNILSYKTFHGQ